ncbi:MAG: glycosyltransferase family 2 protein, partial [Myxococcota bacterium]
MDPLPALVIPALRPAARLVPLVNRLLEDGYPRIVIVDDGSGSGHRPVFERLRRLPRVEVLTHMVNLGKGAALKTGLNHLFAEDPDLWGVVTVDSDGQHLPEDVRRVAAALAENPDRLVMGVRAFEGPVPWKSRIGNGLSRWILWILSGQRLGDTQTGLRGIPRDFVPVLLPIRASRYDFEQEMIVLASRHGVRLLQVPIQTLYRDDNQGSHFDPIADSLRVYLVFFLVLMRALRTTLLDFAVFAACFWLGAPLLA